MVIETAIILGEFIFCQKSFPVKPMQKKRVIRILRSGGGEKRRKRKSEGGWKRKRRKSEKMMNGGKNLIKSLRIS